MSNYGVVMLPKRGRSSAVKEFLDIPTGAQWKPLRRTVPVGRYIAWMRSQDLYQEWEAHDIPDDMSVSDEWDSAIGPGQLPVDGGL